MPATATHRALIVTLDRARGSLAAVRMLGEAGWEVGVGTPDGAGMVTSSRWCRHRHVVPRPRGDCEGFVAGVNAAIDQNGYDLVFGGSDDWMAALSAYRDQIGTTVAHPPIEVVERALDKLELRRLAEGAGVASPRTVPATEEHLRSWQGPVVVKCRSHWFRGQRQRHRIEARRFDRAGEAATRVRLLRDAGFEPLLQEPVDGDLQALIGIVHEGRLLGRVQQETSRLWPTPSGVSARARTVEIDDDLAERCERLLVELGWTGLVELQFLRPPGGTRQLIDFNGRFYGSMALARAAGVNLCDAWARQTLGLPFPDLRDAEPGHRFAWGAGDVRRALAERRGGPVRDVASSLWWARRSTTSVWDRRDFGPTRSLVAGRLRPTVRDVDDDGAGPPR